jgi:hypothetical protein
MGGVGWEPMLYPTLNPMLVRPVEVGLWKLHETYDGTYIIDDLLDVLEILDVRDENRARAVEYEKRLTNG